MKILFKFVAMGLFWVLLFGLFLLLVILALALVDMFRKDDKDD